MCHHCNPELGMKFFQFQAARHLLRSSLCLYGECPWDALLLHLKNLFRGVPCSLVVRCHEAHRHLLGKGHLNQNWPALQLLQMYCSCTYKRYMRHVYCKVDNTDLEGASKNELYGFCSDHSLSSCHLSRVLV